MNGDPTSDLYVYTCVMLWAWLDNAGTLWTPRKQEHKIKKEINLTVYTGKETNCIFKASPQPQLTPYVRTLTVRCKAPSTHLTYCCSVCCSVLLSVLCYWLCVSFYLNFKVLNGGKTSACQPQRYFIQKNVMAAANPIHSSICMFIMPEVSELNGMKWCKRTKRTQIN